MPLKNGMNVRAAIVRSGSMGMDTQQTADIRIRPIETRIQAMLAIPRVEATAIQMVTFCGTMAIIRADGMEASRTVRLIHLTTAEIIGTAMITERSSGPEEGGQQWLPSFSRLRENNVANFTRRTPLRVRNGSAAF